MKKLTTILLVVVLVLACVTGMVACNKNKGPENNDKTLVVGYDLFSNKFSPFFSETAYDQDVWSMTAVGLLAGDRGGAIIYDGIAGETVKYNGTDYTYYGLGKVVVKQNNDGSVFYDITVRDGDKTIYFSDGKPVTIDDVIFSMYVLSDPDYDGASTFYSLPIKGMREYRLGVTEELIAKYEPIAAACKAAYESTYADYDAKVKVLQDAFNATFAEAIQTRKDAKAAADSAYALAEKDAATVKEAELDAAGEDAAAIKAANDKYAAAVKAAADVKKAAYTAADDTYKATEGIAAATEALNASIAEIEVLDYVCDGTETFNQNQYDLYYSLIWPEAGKALARDIVSYCNDNYCGYASFDSVANGMACWGFGDVNEDGTFTSLLGKTYTLVGTDVPSIADYAENIKADYGGNFMEAADVEAANADYDEYMTAVANAWISKVAIAEMGGKTIDSIEGIKKTGSNSMRITTTEFSAVTIYQLAITVAPKHYYGDVAKYDYDNNKFGFTKGDLSVVRAKTTQPMGAGPYKFISFENGIVTFEANENYWQGAPKTKYIKFKQYASDSDKTPALTNGDVDITQPSISESVVSQIKAANTNGELIGNKITTDLIDYNGYGYIGICSDVVNVGGKANKGSEASKNLRKGFATLFAAYREYTVNSYYGDRAGVINYPISNCSWAAPQSTDEGYAIAYSKDVAGNPIYTADMTDEAKFAAALQATVGFFKAAGFEFNAETGKFVDFPTYYEFVLPGGGTGDHPTLTLANKCKAALKTIGVNLTVTDLADSNKLWDGLNSGTIAIWAAAWGGASDPDMYQVYYSANLTGSNHYRIADDELDELIIDARKSSDTTYRKACYKSALEIVLDWGVEIPVYQRKDCFIYSSERVNIDSFTPDRTPFWSWLAEIEKVEMK